MNTLRLNPTDLAQWKALVDDAEDACQLHLQDDLKSYLIFLLIRYTGAAELGGTIVALEYLQGLESHGRLQEERLSEVGDKCLLFSGLFPGRAERRRVRVGYYVSLGAAAYDFLADHVRGAKSRLYHELARHFVPLMDLLQATRTLDQALPTLDPLQAIELWSDTGSQGAWRALRGYTDGFPVAMPVPASAAGFQRGARAGWH